MKKVFVTGATGFVGKHLKSYLETKGYQVFSAGRKDLVDIYSAEAWRMVLEHTECEAVVHLIAKTHADDAADPSSLSSYRRVNVDITKALLRACTDVDIKRFVYLSSIKAVGEETSIDEPFTEESPCRPEDSYGITKRETEELVLVHAKEMRPVILRPPLIYGPGVKGNFPRLVRTIQRGIPLPFASVRNARNLLYVGNLVAVIERVLQIPLVTAGIYHISDKEAIGTPDLIRLIANALGQPPRLFCFPPTVLETVGSMIGKKETIKKLTRSLVVSNNKAKKNLLLHFQHSLEYGLNITLNDICQSN